MKTAGQYFIAVYTNEVKEYCDARFFRRLFKLSKGNPVHIVDNSDDSAYCKRLAHVYRKYNNFSFSYITVNRQLEDSLFHRRVTESVLLLRDKFLQTDAPYFLIVESDVLPPGSLLKKFDRAITKLDNTDSRWGILGGLYHKDFHKYYLKAIQKTHHVLSGCSVYKRSLIEKYPFRWSKENMKAFPDAWICYDSGQEYNLYNDHRITCGHMENSKTGTRYSKAI